MGRGRQPNRSANVRVAFAILFSALLVLGQSALPCPVAFAKAEPQCARCSCGKQCCVGQPSRAPLPCPAAPAQNLPLTHPSFAVVATQVTLLPSRSAVTLSVPSFSRLKFSAVPIYDWNCAYLI